MWRIFQGDPTFLFLSTDDKENKSCPPSITPPTTGWGLRLKLHLEPSEGMNLDMIYTKISLSHQGQLCGLPGLHRRCRSTLHRSLGRRVECVLYGRVRERGNVVQWKEHKLFFLKSTLLRCNINDREGNGTPLQYSCLENPMDGGAWWAAVQGVAKSWTRFHFHALEKEMATHACWEPAYCILSEDL